MATYDVGRVCAVLVLLDVIAVYWYCVGIRGVYPPSHPWSGVALLLLSFGMVRRLRRRDRSTPSTVAQWSPVLAVLAAGLWTISAFVR